jgi:hypothetical protein
LAKKLNVFHQSELRKTADLRKNFAPAEKTVISAPHSQQQSGVVTETVCQPIDGIFPRQSNAKKPADYLSILQRLFNFSERSGRHLSIGVKEPENIGARDLSPGVHLRGTIRFYLNEAITKAGGKIDSLVSTHPVGDNDLSFRGTLTQTTKRFLNERSFV